MNNKETLKGPVEIDALLVGIKQWADGLFDLNSSAVTNIERRSGINTIAQEMYGLLSEIKTRGLDIENPRPIMSK